MNYMDPTYNTCTVVHTASAQPHPAVLLQAALDRARRRISGQSYAL